MALAGSDTLESPNSFHKQMSSPWVLTRNKVDLFILPCITYTVSSSYMQVKILKTEQKQTTITLLNSEGRTCYILLMYTPYLFYEEIF